MRLAQLGALGEPLDAGGEACVHRTRHGLAGELTRRSALAGSPIMLGIKSDAWRVASMLMGVASFACMDAAGSCFDRLPSFRSRAAQISGAAGGVHLGDVCGRPERQLVRIRWPLHLIRGVLSVFMMATFIYGIQKLSLAKTYALFFVAPLLIAIFSTFMLGERVIRTQWVAIVIGFAGVLFVRPPEIAGWVAPLAIWGVRCATRFRQFS